MKLNLSINYESNWGQILYVSGSDKTLGEWIQEQAVQMEYVGNNIWNATIEIEDELLPEYKYFVLEANGAMHWEGGSNRMLPLLDQEEIFIRDYWHAVTDKERVMLTKVFTDVIMKPAKLQKQSLKTHSKSLVEFKMLAPRVGKGYALALLGEGEALGDWKTPLIMSNQNYPFWTLSLDRELLNQDLEYKYVIVEQATGEIRSWEDRPNRTISLPQTKSDGVKVILNDEKFVYPVGEYKGAGVAVPIFSLRSNEGFGVGEFNDLKKLVDWCVKSGLKMIQVLPINETVATHSWLDSYPYKSISVMALHPMYLHLPAMGKLYDKEQAAVFDELREQLNQLQHVDYVTMFAAKARYFKLIFDQNWEYLSKQKDYQSFFTANRSWLMPYAAFCYLRDQYKTSDFRAWEQYATYDHAKIVKLCNPKNDFHEHIAVHYFIQYHLDKQLREAINYAHANGIAVKGDIPIGISPNSIEAWSEPAYFNLNAQAGAPPDDFAVMGQNWGFPTYNWDEMARDGFGWWRKRLSMMEKYFDAYRIDHILGFFRIWEIPLHAIHGLQGYFKPGLPLTPNEIEEKGVWFDEELFTKPYIRGHFLADFFGEFTDEVRKKYLIEVDFGCFELKEAFNTQRKIYNHFTPQGETSDISGKTIIIRDGLMGLLNEVLFIKDPYAAPRAYHPRIAFHFTYAYRELDPNQKQSLNALYIDYFYRRHDDFWKWHAMGKLPAIAQASNMLICGEDLGMVPDGVPEVMQQLNMLSLEVQRMPKNPKVEFAHPADAPYLSVCTTSTHDMSTIRGWWEEDREKINRFYHHILGHNNSAPFFAEPWICKEIINQHMHSPAMWVIFPIQDLIAIDGSLRWDQTDKERINVPSNPENKWRYRMTLSLQELLRAKNFNKLIKDLVHLSGRDADY
ncbi:MAG: 4-alpha-glucanotransferase [Bacteroidetes bacterium]|jgi:4-alpha-glucanotransferase|nr:4-alpha-glucanotransferase [Bacteroidota bacterium]